VIVGYLLHLIGGNYIEARLPDLSGDPAFLKQYVEVVLTFQPADLMEENIRRSELVFKSRIGESFLFNLS